MSSESSGWFVDYDHNGNVLGVASPDRTHDLDFIAVLNDEAKARAISASLEMLAALKAISSNPHCDLGDLVYRVRESEGEGWDGPAVIAWSNAVQAVKTAIQKAEPKQP